MPAFERGYQEGYAKGIDDGKKLGYSVGHAKGLLALDKFIKDNPVIIVGCIPKGCGRSTGKAISCKECIFERNIKDINQRKICLMNAEIFFIVNKFTISNTDFGKPDEIPSRFGARKIG
jgi:hypothetical protein